VFLKVKFVFLCFCVSVYYFGFMLLVLLGFVFFSVPSQETGGEDHLQNDLFCVEWDAKPCSMPFLLIFGF